MKRMFYPQLAWDSIRKNKQLYVPYILTCIGMVMMYNIITGLALANTPEAYVGGGYIGALLGMGGWVIALFSCIFLFYTNSFLMRRRKKEFGLYNILGMSKWSIVKILFWETLIISVISLTVGLILGILLSKLAELGLMNIIHEEINYRFTIFGKSIVMTLKIFGTIFGLLFFNSVIRLASSNAITLVRSENRGEKPPKGNWLLGMLGILLLAYGYYLSVTIKNPTEAFNTGFTAVLMVIVGTYLIMICCSVLFCRILKRRQGYYYKANHFVSVSSMAYRMKRNGAGLASICILATMTLVIMSTTTCLYAGLEDSLNQRCPRDISIEFGMQDPEGMQEENIRDLQSGILDTIQMYGLSPKRICSYRYAVLYGVLEEDVAVTNPNGLMGMMTDSLGTEMYCYCFVPLSDYNELMGTEETLEAGEVLISTNRTAYPYDTLSFEDGREVSVKKKVDFIFSGESMMSIFSSMAVIVPDLDAALQGDQAIVSVMDDSFFDRGWFYAFDLPADAKTTQQVYQELDRVFGSDDLKSRYGYDVVSCEEREDLRQSFYQITGGLFYLGILLSIVFLFATILIIYYKQISEGYEDEARFEIMQKIGMTKKEIRKSINSQILTVFFLPLILAVVHLAFAFPMFHKMLMLFNLFNIRLFIVTTGISVLIFAVFYALVYRITSDVYYKIVSEAKQ